MSVLVLNADYSFLSTTSWQNAVCLLIEGKAESVKKTERVVRNQNRTVTVEVPSVIRLIKFIRSIFKTKVPYSKRNIIARDAQVCQYCGEHIPLLKNCTVDHVVPKAQKGKSSWLNCVCSCKKCNWDKADRTPKQAGMRLKRQPYRPTIGEHIQYYTKLYGVDEMLEEVFAAEE